MRFPGRCWCFLMSPRSGWSRSASCKLGLHRLTPRQSRPQRAAPARTETRPGLFQINRKMEATSWLINVYWRPVGSRSQHHCCPTSDNRLQMCEKTTKAATDAVCLLAFLQFVQLQLSTAGKGRNPNKPHRNECNVKRSSSEYIRALQDRPGSDWAAQMGCMWHTGLV